MTIPLRFVNRDPYFMPYAIICICLGSISSPLRPDQPGFPGRIRQTPLDGGKSTYEPGITNQSGEWILLDSVFCYVSQFLKVILSNIHSSHQAKNESFPLRFLYHFHFT